MTTTIINIGNSRGIRIPKPILEESGIGETVELKVKKGEIKIVPALPKKTAANSMMLLPEKALEDWNNPEEDEAWASLQ